MKRAATRRLKEALLILQSLGVPREQQNDRSALTLLAFADLLPTAKWSSVTAPLRRITEMMDWMRDHYGVTYAPNTRETIRRQTVHQFVQLGIVIENPDQPDRPINSPKWCYQLSAEVLPLLQAYGTSTYTQELEQFLQLPKASALDARHRDLPREMVSLPDGTTIELSAGGQNTLIQSIVEEFARRFVCGPKILFLGDAADKEIVADADSMKELGIALPERGKAPDVLIHDTVRDWLIIVEAVTSHGPVDQKRKNELTELFADARPGLVFVTAFPDRKTYAKFQAVIAWETEVWIADAPDHMIHFNGKRFLGPYS